MPPRACSSRRCRRWPTTGRPTTTGASSRSASRPCPHFITEIDGVDIHFIHVRSEHEDALPLIVTHGWPGSIDRAAEDHRAAHQSDGAWRERGGRVPPGDPVAAGPRVLGQADARPAGIPIRIARAWAVLMERLGYTRYVAQGGDWGNAVTEQLALLKPAGLLGIHTNMPATVPPDDLEGRPARRAGAGRPLGRRAEGLRDPGPLLRDRHRLRAGDGQPPADALWHRGLAGRPGGLDARSRRAQLRADRARLRRAIPAASRATTSSTTSPTTG